MVKTRLWVVAMMAVPMSCASTPFGYKYYALDAENYAGSLRGPQPTDDLPLAQCQPTAANKAPCITVFTDEFLRLKTEVLQLREDLKACQSKP